MSWCWHGSWEIDPGWTWCCMDYRKLSIWSSCSTERACGKWIWLEKFEGQPRTGWSSKERVLKAVWRKTGVQTIRHKKQNLRNYMGNQWGGPAMILSAEPEMGLGRKWEMVAQFEKKIYIFLYFDCTWSMKNREVNLRISSLSEREIRKETFLWICFWTEWLCHTGHMMLKGL
jgi:hypothetical protein